MLIDARKVDEGYNFETDVCIIGGGPAGISLAREFVNQEFNVLLLESGGEKFKHPAQWLNIGYNIGRSYFDLVFTRHRMLGGSTYKWYRLCRPLDPIDFERRDWVPYSGWPFERKDLDPYYERACEFFQLPTTEFTTGNYLENGQSELKNEEIETIVFQFSPHTSFGGVYTHEIAGSDNVKVLINANVLEIDVDGGGTNIQKVKVVSQNKRNFSISAEVFILACGGIENARLLLVSNRVWVNGLGNQNDLVGRFFNEHHSAFYAEMSSSEDDFFRGIYKTQDYSLDSKNPSPIAALSVQEDVSRQKQLLNAIAFIVTRSEYKLGAEYNSESGHSFSRLSEILTHAKIPNGTFWKDCGNFVSQPTTLLRILQDQVNNWFSPVPSVSLRIIAETAPNPDSRVTLSEKRDRLGMNRINLDWRLTRQDLENYNQVKEILSRGIRVLGFALNEVKHEVDDCGWPHTLKSGRHHSGTTRMHLDPKRGVVDPNCKVHGTENLYIAGSSVFPTSGSANPTLTIVALALRLADHIKLVMN